MAYSEALTTKVREALRGVKSVTEKKMFRGVTFMVNKKMLITVGDNEVMVRIDPKEHTTVLEKYHGRTMTMKGREYLGYVFIDEALINTRALQALIKKALSYNAVLVADGK